MNDTKKKDIELYNAWKSSGSKKALGELLDNLTPIIYSEVHRASGSLPTAALSAEAKNWAFKAIETYNPDRGVALSTHVMNYLPKVRRLNYKFQNAVRLPENMQLKFHEFNHSLTTLTDQLSRDPTDEELASHLGWSKAHTIKFKNSLYSDLIESGSQRSAEFTQFNENSILMEHLMSQLTADEKFILDNSKNMPVPEMAKKLGVNINRFNYLKSKLISKIKKIKEDARMY